MTTNLDNSAICLFHFSKCGHVEIQILYANAVMSNTVSLMNSRCDRCRGDFKK